MKAKTVVKMCPSIHTNAKQAAATNNYTAAISCLDTALTLTDAAEFVDPDQESGPMSLQLELMKLYYTGKQHGFSPAPMMQGVNQLIAIYETEAQDNNWYAYGMLSPPGRTWLCSW